MPDPNSNQQDNNVNDEVDVNQQQDNQQQQQDNTQQQPSDGIEGIVDNLLADEERRANRQQTQNNQQQSNKQQQQNRQQQQTDNNQQQDPNQQQGRRIPLRGVPGAFADEQGNIVDWQGRPIARSGAEARHFNQSGRAGAQLLDRLQKAEQELEVLHKAHGIKDGGLSAAEVLMGHQLAAAWKKDPKQTLQFMLRQAAEQGISVEGIGNANDISVPAIVDAVTKAIQEKLLHRFEPVFKDWEDYHSEREFNAKVDKDVGEFFGQYPDAKLHEDVIADVMKASDYQLNMQQAYTMTMKYAMENGLDWKKPLRQQMQGASNDTGANASRRTSHRELPPVGGGGNAAATRARVKTGNPSDSWESLINETFDEIGLQR